MKMFPNDKILVSYEREIYGKHNSTDVDLIVEVIDPTDLSINWISYVEVYCKPKTTKMGIRSLRTGNAKRNGKSVSKPYKWNVVIKEDRIPDEYLVYHAKEGFGIEAEKLWNKHKELLRKKGVILDDYQSGYIWNGEKRWIEDDIGEKELIRILKILELKKREGKVDDEIPILLNNKFCFPILREDVFRKISREVIS